MSENTGSPQPIQPIKEEDTQPIKPVKKAPRWRSLLFSILGVVILLFLGGLGGYESGIQNRTNTESQLKSQQLTEQYQFALVDEKFGRFDAAKERLDYIIQNDPSFPGVQNELAKLLVQMSIPTATPTPAPTSTPDIRGEQSLFATAQQLVAAGNWANALTELDQLRKEDPNFNTAQVDGMYYYTLRNYGMNLIQQQCNLEAGIYELTLAERFAQPLDRDASGLREAARAYINASSFFGVNWQQAVESLAQVAPGYPSLCDGTMNAGQRYQIALMRYGDQLLSQSQYCPAYQQYQAALAIGDLDAAAAKGENQANQECNPATEVPATAAEVPTGAATADTPTTAAPPADTPVPTTSGP